jgi:hypothetical protein
MTHLILDIGWEPETYLWLLAGNAIAVGLAIGIVHGLEHLRDRWRR